MLSGAEHHVPPLEMALRGGRYAASSGDVAMLDVSAHPPAPLQIVRGIGLPKGPSEKAKEAKRARRSEIERQSRLRRNSQYGSMRAEVSRLQRLEAALLAERTSSLSVGLDHNVARRRDQYLRVVSEVKKLREEQSRLQVLLDERSLLSLTLQEMAEVFVEEDMVTWDRKLTSWYKPLAVSDAVIVMKDSCEVAATFDEGGPWQSSGGQFMGWRDKRKLNEVTSTMIHRFSKTFPGRLAQDLMEKSWDMFCLEWFLQKTVVNSSTELHIQVLQILNENIRVIKRQTRYLAIPHKSFHTVYMMFRIQTEDGFSICLKSVDIPELRRSLTEDETWVDVFHWITFTHAGDGCEVTFGGTINSGVLSFALHWLIESALAVVRWETVCVAPLFILPPQSGAEEGVRNSKGRTT